MDRSEVQVAARLLAKAQSTNSDEEAAALVEKSYVLLARFLNAHEEQAQATTRPRRRERRLLRDRRSDRRGSKPDPAPHPTDPAALYRRLTEEPRPPGKGQIDLRA